MEEHRDLGGAWLDALDDHAGIPRLNGYERVRQLSGEENPEGLVRDPTDPSVPQPATASLVERESYLQSHLHSLPRLSSSSLRQASTFTWPHGRATHIKI